MNNFKRGDIVLGDCYYASFFLIATLLEIGVDIVFPVHAARKSDFCRGKKLGKKDHLVEWKRPAKPEWMDENMYQSFPKQMIVREVSISSERPGFRSKSRVLVTTFLDPADVSKIVGRTWYCNESNFLPSPSCCTAVSIKHQVGTKSAPSQ